MKPWIAAVAVAGLVAALVYGTLAAGRGARCHVCVSFRGATQCSDASAATRAEAERGAFMTACSVLSHGVTDGLACQREVPDSVTCSE